MWAHRRFNSFHSISKMLFFFIYSTCFVSFSTFFPVVFRSFVPAPRVGLVVRTPQCFFCHLVVRPGLARLVFRGCCDCASCCYYHRRRRRWYRKKERVYRNELGNKASVSRLARSLSRSRGVEKTRQTNDPFEAFHRCDPPFWLAVCFSLSLPSVAVQTADPEAIRFGRDSRAPRRDAGWREKV